MTKIIEISRPLGSPNIPSKRYQHKLTEEQYQFTLREIANKTDSDMTTTPSLVLRDEENAVIEVIREFTYPVELSDNAETETENIGLTSHFLARHIRGKDISLKAFVRFSEFEALSDVEPGFSLPVFNQRDVEFSEHLKSGETVLVGGILSETSQKVEDSYLHGAIKKTSSNKLSKELIIAVTAQLIKADGSNQ